MYFLETHIKMFKLSEKLFKLISIRIEPGNTQF